MTSIASAVREHQRFEHLVLERPRPPLPAPRKPRGMSRVAWKAAKARLVERMREEAVLAPGVEEWVALREDWAGAGTPQTHRLASQRAGALARLHATGAVSHLQLLAATEIAETHEAIVAAVAIRSSFGFDRVDNGFRPDLAGAIGAHVARERLYDRWRAAIDGPVGAVLAMIVDDMGLVAAARTWRMSDRRARSLLIGALNLWNTLNGRRAAPEERRGG